MQSFFLSWVKCAVISTAIKIFRRKTSKMEMRETLWSLQVPDGQWQNFEEDVRLCCYGLCYRCSLLPFKIISRLPCKSLIIKMFLLTTYWFKISECFGYHYEGKTFFHSSDSTYYYLNFYLLITHADWIHQLHYYFPRSSVCLMKTPGLSQQAGTVATSLPHLGSTVINIGSKHKVLWQMMPITKGPLHREITWKILPSS